MTRITKVIFKELLSYTKKQTDVNDSAVRHLHLIRAIKCHLGIQGTSKIYSLKELATVEYKGSHWKSAWTISIAYHQPIKKIKYKASCNI
jgi:hypothetical protein